MAPGLTFYVFPSPGRREMSHFCSVMDAGPGPVDIRYIPVIEIWTMHRITTTSQNTDQDVISSSSRWSVSKMMPRTLHPFYFLLMAAYNQVRIHPANFKFHMFRTHPGFLTRLALEFIFNVPKYRVLARSGCALGLHRMRAK